jgi:hypothetical protein
VPKGFKRVTKAGKIIKKTGWPTNTVTHPTLTGKQIATCSRNAENRQRKCREVLD